MGKKDSIPNKKKSPHRGGGGGDDYEARTRASSTEDKSPQIDHIQCQIPVEEGRGGRLVPRERSGVITATN